MATRSTASSGTDPQDPGTSGTPGTPGTAGGSETPEPPATGPDQRAYDPARRAFFFQFGRQAASAAGQVAGMADIVGRTSSALAGELLGLDEPSSATEGRTFTRSGAATDPVVSAAQPAAEHAFRSAYRLSEEGLVLLDQRRLPEALEEVVAKRGSDVAYYLRLGVARGGPLMAQVAAYGLWLTAVERADAPVEQRRAELQRTSSALIDARASSRSLAWAVDRMRRATDRLEPSAPGAQVAAALRIEADAIADEVTAAEAAMALALEEALRQEPGRPLTVLLHGCQGSLVAGQLGAGLVAFQRIREAGRDLRVFVTEGRPFMDGARLLSWELRQAGIEHKVLPDAAAAWLLDREPVDAVVTRAEWVAANGDAGALLGARALAQLTAAARSVDGVTRFLLVAPAAVIDTDTPDGSFIPSESRPARELTAYLSDTPIRAADALVPAADIVPAALIDTLVTEQDAYA
ncbi:MAG: hypothetical protein AB1Z67_01125 [Candidatus Limnocylindrales bacterium]